MTTRTYNLPIADEGDGGVVAEIKVRDGQLDWTALLAIAEVLGRSSAPITVSFAVDRPPPLFVTPAEAAKSLGTAKDYIDKLIREGVLPVVEWNNAEHGARIHQVIPWESLVTVAEEARRTGELPLITRRLRAKPPRPKGRSIASLVYDVLRDAKAAGEEPLSMEEMTERTTQRLWDISPEHRGQPVPYRTVQAAQHQGIKRNLVQRHELGYRPGKSGPIYRYSWRPEIEALIQGRDTKRERARQAKQQAEAAV